MPNSNSKARVTVKLKGGLDHTASWARVLEDGRIELEYFDYSPDAQDHFGNDVAWMYRIGGLQRPRLVELLGSHTGTVITDDQTMLDAFAGSFRDAWDIRDWLKKAGIPYDEEFDSWA